MEENKLVDLSFEFAKMIVNIVDSIKTPKSSYMVDQLARAGTSVRANITLQALGFCPPGEGRFIFSLRSSNSPLNYPVFYAIISLRSKLF